MKVVSVNIENYRAISSLPMSFLSPSGRVRPITVIVGPNGCGKTSILFAIAQTLRGVMGYRTTDVPEPTRDDIRVPHSTQSAWTDSPPEARVAVQVEFDEAECIAIPEILTKLGKGRPPALPDNRLTVHWRFPPGFERDGTRREWWYADIDPPLQYVRSWLMAKREAIRALNQRRSDISYELLSKVGGFEFFPQDRSLLNRVIGNAITTSNSTDRDDFDTDESADVEFTRPGRHDRHDRPVSDILEELAYQAKKGSPDAITTQGQIQQLFEKVCFPKKYIGFMYRDALGAPVLQDGNHTYPLANAASGEHVILDYITRFFYRANVQRSLVLIDEPEVHLHPKWIRQFYIALTHLGQHTQFILTTHSDELRRRAAADNSLVELGPLEGV